MSESCPVEFMTVKQAAELAGVSGQRIRQLCGEGRLAAFKIAGVWLILEASVYEWMRSYRKPGPVPGGARPKGEQLRMDDL